MNTEKNIPEPHYFELFKATNTFILDVDGVLTDGSLLITNNGDELRTMNIRDGYALQWAVKKGYQVIVISGGYSEGVVKRLNRLGIAYVLAGVSDKVAALQQVSKALSLDLSKSIYIGDDVPDLDAMRSCGIPCCPADAAPEIAAVSKYISPQGGGKGCVRDIIEKVMKLQEKW